MGRGPGLGDDSTGPLDSRLDAAPRAPNGVGRLSRGDDLLGQDVDLLPGASCRPAEQREGPIGRKVEPLDEDAFRLLDHDPGLERTLELDRPLEQELGRIVGLAVEGENGVRMTAVTEEDLAGRGFPVVDPVSERVEQVDDPLAGSGIEDDTDLAGAVLLDRLGGEAVQILDQTIRLIGAGTDDTNGQRGLPPGDADPDTDWRASRRLTEGVSFLRLLCRPA